MLTAMQWLTTTLLLIGSNTFMTFAWYFHLRKESWGMVRAIVVSWLIAFFEYCLQVCGLMEHITRPQCWPHGTHHPSTHTLCTHRCPPTGTATVVTYL